MIIDGVFASEAIDSSGEILDVKGCDISDLEAGLGVLNWEHRGDDAEGASANDIIGKIVFAKKIYGPEDCTDSRQLDYWQKIQLPLIYGIVRLFDGSGHPGALAAAAIIRDYEANKEPLLVRYSIEGTTLKKDKSSNRLLESVARRVAATIKPCNKSCHSGLISDPRADVATDSSTRKNELDAHPNFTPLGGSFEYECGVVESESIKKALEAGSYNAAPSALVGGSALQVEDKSLRNRVKAAVRDWDRKSNFKKFLKHRLPEAGDEFIDRFAGLVEDYTIKKAQRDTVKAVVKQKIAQKIQAKAKPDKAPKPALATAPAPVPQPPDDAMTIRGQKIFPNADISPAFDENTGVLHTARGSFPMYIPSRDPHHPDAGQTFHNIMNDPKVGQFHDYAMANWSKLHEHLKAGTLPPEVIMHGVLFSQMSPNTPVPMQEMMYAHMVDAMKETGIDPRNPDPKKLNILRQDWLKRDRPQQWPEHSREHFKRLEGVLRNNTDSNLTGRKAGDIGGFQLGPNKFKNIAKYHSLHSDLVDLMGRHRENVQGAMEELMHHKNKSKLWDAKRRRDLDKGYEDPGEYTGGPDVPGLAPKTGRYTMGMLGGGNVVVPDTHFTRYLFGLDRQKDGESIEYLKRVLWNTGNTHVMNGIDRYYAKHHDAVKHMLAHPTWGKTFAKPEDATFPAFWKNWVGILPHEAARGMKTNGFNESTDHRPFWDAVGPYLNKAEKAEMNTHLAVRTAQTHHEWVKQYGEMPAMLMYFHYLVPQLLEAGAKRTQEETVRKFEAVSIELLKADGAAPQAELKRPETVQFNGKTVKPGSAFGYGDDGDYALLDHHPDHYTAVPEEKIHSWNAEDLVKLPRRAQSMSYRVLKPPEHLEAPSVISHEVHTIPEYTHHPETQALVHGLDLDGPKKAARSGKNNANSFWTKNAQGKRVYVKGEIKGTEQNNTSFTDANREGLYHNLAKDFYGLGQYVNPTTPIHDPANGNKMTVVEHVDGEHRDPNAPHEDRARHTQHLKKLWDSGELQKIAIMDQINHASDRHDHNYMLTPDGGMKLIDHGDTFSMSPFAPFNEFTYLKGLGTNKAPINLAAAKWLMSLKPHELELQMRRHRTPETYINETGRRLRGMQAHIKNNLKAGQPAPGFNDTIYSPFNLR